jgi:hypothetical protein
MGTPRLTPAFAWLRVKIGDVGRAYGHTLVLGYRQYFWHGLNLDLELWGAYDPIKSSIDGKMYRGVDLWVALLPGYRWDFWRQGEFDVYALAQVEFGYPAFRTNPPPNLPGKSIFVIPLLWFGFRL